MTLNAAWRIALAAIAFLAMGTGRVAAAPLTLNEAIDRALVFAPSVSMVSAESEVSKARTREQRAPLFPTLTAGTEYYQGPGYNTTVTNRGLSAGLIALNYTAWDWGRREAQYRAARYVSEAAQLGVAAARAQIAFDTSIAYYDLLRARASERELGFNLERLSRYVATVEALQASGRAITNDVLKIRSARNAAELVLSSAHNATQLATANLGSLLGDFNASDIAIVDTSDIPSLPSGDIAEAPAMRSEERRVGK